MWLSQATVVNKKNVTNIQPIPSQQNEPNHHIRTKNPTLSRGLSNVSQPQTYAGIFGTTSNLVNSIVGAGIVGIPYAFKESGMVAGILLVVLVGWMTNKALRMIVDTACFHPKLATAGVRTYEDLMSVPFGRFGTISTLGSMFITAYGAMLSFFIIIKDNVPKLIGLNNQANLVMFATTLVIILPLAMKRDIANLSLTSFVSVLAAFILIIFIAIFSPIEESISDAGGLGHVITQNIVSANVFIGLGVIGSAMKCHTAFIVSGSLQEKTSTRWGKATTQALTFATILCVAMGLFGYLGFLDHTRGDILNNFPAIFHVKNKEEVDDSDSNGDEEHITEMENIYVYDRAATGARTLLAITMFLTYPMESFVARHVLCKFFFLGDMDGDVYDDHGILLKKKKYCFCCLGRREFLSLCLYISTLVFAFLVDDVGPVLSITGAIGASCLAYISPGLAYLGINGEAFLTYVSEKIVLVSSQVTTNTDEHEKLHFMVDSRDKDIDDNASDHTNVTETTDIEEIDTKDGTTTILTTTITTTSTIETLYHRIKKSKKTFWYWFCGFPLWCWIAYKGSKRTEQALDKFNQDYPLSHDNFSTQSELVRPCTKDYYISMFFITFGMVSSILGLVQNILFLMK